MLVSETCPNYPDTARAIAIAWPNPREEGTLFRFGEYGTSVELDLGTPQGRFELVALAILCGAKVRETSALATFDALRQSGLLEIGHAAEGSLELRVEMATILREHYRALANKTQKVEAIIAAAQIIRDEYENDLALAYRDDWRETIASLQRFPHVKSRAYWICRELRRHGVWPDLAPRACVAVDTSVKLALWRTGFVGRDARFLRDISTSDCVAVIDRHFGGDPLPVFYQGEKLCRLQDRAVCRTRCSVLDACQAQTPLRRRPRKTTEQPFVSPQGPVDNVDNSGVTQTGQQ